MNTGQTMASQRIQLKRTKGWRIPPNTAVVSRPRKWGNPFKVVDGDRATAVRSFAAMIAEGNTPPFTAAIIREQLAGKNLACWCPVGEPCHGDVLLAVANTPNSDARISRAEGKAHVLATTRE